MIRRSFAARSKVRATARELFAWHDRPGALERLLPPWERVEVLERTGGIRDAGRVRMRMRAGPFRLEWLALHGDFEEGRSFTDEQASGPFARWRHTHLFEDLGEGESSLEDTIEYALPLGRLGDLLGRRAVERRLARMFAHRHEVTRADLERHRGGGSTSPIRVAVSGASGLLGSAIAAFLSTGGHEVLRIVRRPESSRGDEIAWDPGAGRIDAAKLEGVDAIVHLAGANIASGRWTDERKEAIVTSRVRGTRLLAEAAASLRRPPRVFASASAVGFYGDRGEEELDEESATGAGFLAEVCRQWEGATAPLAGSGTRVAHLRFGVVLSSAGGALARMLPAFRAGAGGPVGSGRQFLSWIGRDDAVGAVHFVLFRSALAGAVNVVSPRPATSASFARELGRVLRRPAILPLPAAVVRSLFGEMGRELLLSGQRVVPRRLQEAGFAFRQPTIEDALRFELGRPR